MIDAIFKYLADNVGVSLTLVIIIGVLLVVAAYYIGRKLYEIENLPCKDHHQSIEEHRTDIKNFIGSISRLEGTMNSVLQSVTSMQQTLLYLQTSRPPKNYIPKKFDSYSKKQSPRNLNDNGMELFNDVKGQQFIDSNKAFLFGQIDRFRPKTAYDVEAASLTILRMNLANDIFDRIKNWVYLAPARIIKDDDGNPKKVEVDLDDVLFVISLPLRDAYLQEHPDLVPEKEANPS